MYRAFVILMKNGYLDGMLMICIWRGMRYMPAMDIYLRIRICRSISEVNHGIGERQRKYQIAL